MLKALELVGFKSFADRTQLDFPKGITVVVGPNGSGKSNIVDAIKWVLGEQSARSLRGKEMADVIFNGSGSRPPMNTAETTLTFDNSQRMLPIDTPEVHVTRRVYRSGEGEYLINRQPSRLRDIRDLFAGTGLGTEAYSVIEQGKVDVLLQSSPRERRLIFEEAAGISRFKAKKVESLRRLERVEQNLLRLADIVEEVEHQLKHVRKQATKARRYQEYADRLQSLRTQMGLADWRQLGTRLDELAAQESQLTDRIGETGCVAQRAEADTLARETDIEMIQVAIGGMDARHAELRERIATAESTISHQRQRATDLEAEVARYRRQLAAMSVRAGDLRQQIDHTNSAVATAASNHNQLAEQLAATEAEFSRRDAELQTLRAERERHRSAHLQLLREAASLGNEISAWETQVTSTATARERTQVRMSTVLQALDQAKAELAELEARQADLDQQATQAAETLAASQAQLSAQRREHAHTQTQLAELREQASALRERAAVLDELQQRMEGVEAGAKDILLKARSGEVAWLGQVIGLLADLIEVSQLEYAPLVEIALGEAAQHLVVSDLAALLAGLPESQLEFPARVGFIATKSAPNTMPPEATASPEAWNEPGVLGPAIDFVSVQDAHLPLVRACLDQVWFVADWATAQRLHTAHPDRTFIARTGECLSRRGVLTVGPKLTTSGLIARRSQLRELSQKISEIDVSIAQSETQLETLARAISESEKRVQIATGEAQQSAAALVEQRSLVRAAQQRCEQSAQLHRTLTEEQTALDRQLEAATLRSTELQARLQLVEQSQQTAERALAAAAEQIDSVEASHRQQQREMNQARVELAKSEERLGNLQRQQGQFQRDQDERRRALADSREHLVEGSRRLTEAQFIILGAESQIAELYLAKESLAQQTILQVNRREILRAERAQALEATQQARREIRQWEEQLHTLQLGISEIRLQRDSLAARLRDDYAIELAQLELEPSAEEQRQRAEVDEEIAELRRKISNIGNVNLDSLEEVAELESRFQKLSAQYQDLSHAKQALERIIAKINTDSRRLFAETFETVRTHFRELFQKIFGGGQADLLLDEGIDILDSGIEIIARPPGKEPRSISLLSGGEKTLTCVALLLAIFRSRPSPFCVLDEVDAALDEANIERFIGVLREFLGWTQFVIVTHSKKTMTCANTLHGVTMQESGVSKRVSVRFEDVSDNGEIRLAPPTGNRPDNRDETQAA
jgi:chromosome segregation protein